MERRKKPPAPKKVERRKATFYLDINLLAHLPAVASAEDTTVSRWVERRLRRAVEEELAKLGWG